MQRALIFSLLLIGALLSGCIGTEGEDVASQNVDELVEDITTAELPATITGIEQIAQVDKADEMSGAGIWTDGAYAYVSGLGTGFHVVDISDPEEPRRVGSISGDEVYSRDVDMMHYEDRTVVVLATQSGGMTFVNVTDPTNPEILNIVKLDPNHNVAVVPGTDIVYNSPSRGTEESNAIVHAPTPEQAEIVGEFGAYGCHDITFFISEDGEKKRAYCAGQEMTEIWDIADPLNPEVISQVSNPCMDRAHGELPRSTCGGLHHSAFVNEDASLLLMGDEFMGGGGPGCSLSVSQQGTSVSSPIGALWFYDITDEENPSLVGWFAPEAPAENHLQGTMTTVQESPTGPSPPSCTSHFGEIIPGHDKLVMGWYEAGVLLIDFSDPANPVQVDQWNPDTVVWDAQVHNGYIFTGDISRGSDVLGFLGE